MKGVEVTFLVVLSAMLLGAIRPSEAIDCGQVAGALNPCVPYLTQGGTPTQQCCNGVKNLSNMIPKQQDRRTACNCVKSAAANYPNLKADAASNLPGRCGASINIPISPSTDCNSIP